MARILKLTPGANKNVSEEAAINIISSTLHDNAGSIFYYPTFKPVDKIVELYERMLKEKNELMEGK